jgi:myo-inositol-1(or 4)-monophosphatase
MASYLSYNEMVPMAFRLGRLMEDIGLRILTLRKKNDLSVQEKCGHWDIVTKADKLSEELLVGHVQSQYPDHGVRGEEGALIDGNSGYVWHFDALDGSANFERGSDFFGISAGLSHNGTSIFGMIHFPAFRKTLMAARNYGIFTLNVKHNRLLPLLPRWVIPPPASLKEALVVAYVERGKEHLFGLIRSKARVTAVFNSVVFDIFQLVYGKIDAVFHTGATPFDIAAGIVIAREAGCVVSGIVSDELDLSKGKIPFIMARSHGLRDALREVLIKALT